MIIYPAGHAAAELAAGRPLDRPRIGYVNYCDDEDAVITASTETASGPKDGPTRPDTAEYWQASAMNAWWKLNIGSSKSVGYVGIASHDIGTLGVQVTVETSPDDAAWTLWAQANSPSKNAPLMFLDTPRNAQYVRISLTGASAPKIAVINIGTVLVPERAVFGRYRPIHMNRNTVLSMSLSHGGQFLEQGFRRRGLESEVDFRYFSAAWYEANFDPFVQHATSLPFFFGRNPELFPNEVAYAWVPDDIHPSYTGENDYVSVNFKLMAVGHD